MREDLSLKLQDVVRTHLADLGDGPLPRDVDLVQLGLTSLSSVNLVLDLEDTFQIEFPDNMLTEATFHTLETLEGALRQLIEASTGVRT